MGQALLKRDAATTAAIRSAVVSRNRSVGTVTAIAAEIDSDSLNGADTHDTPGMNSSRSSAYPCRVIAVSSASSSLTEQIVFGVKAASGRARYCCRRAT